MQLVKTDTVCRNLQILSYFNEAEISACGMCDVCLNRKSSYTNISDEILHFLKIHQEATSQEICNHISTPEANVLVNLQQLLSEEIIAINNYNQYYIK